MQANLQPGGVNFGVSPEALALYDRFAQSLGERVPTPALVDVLHAPIPVLLDRIRQRGVAGEDRINRAYLEDLHERYERQWARWDRCPLLYVDNVSLDYGRDPVARAEILRRIDEAIASGRKGRVDEAAQPSLFG